MQTNVKSGELVFTAKEDLTGKEGRLVALVNDSGKAKVGLPDNATDVCPFVLTDVNGVAGGNVSVLPLSPDRNVRVLLSGTCNPGAKLVLATPNGTVDGAVIALPATAGTYRVVGIAEEGGVDGQLLRIRPFVESVTVSE